MKNSTGAMETGERATPHSLGVLRDDVLVLGVGTEKLGFGSLVDNVVALGGALEQLSGVLAHAASSGDLTPDAQGRIADVMQHMLDDFHASALLVRDRQRALERRKQELV